jgi:hypothetical protein
VAHVLRHTRTCVVGWGDTRLAFQDFLERRPAYSVTARDSVAAGTLRLRSGRGISSVIKAAAARRRHNPITRCRATAQVRYAVTDDDVGDDDSGPPASAER